MMEKISANRKISLAVLAAAIAAALWLASWFIAPTLSALFIAVGIWPFYRRMRDGASPKARWMRGHMHLIFALGLLLTFGVTLGLAAQSAIDEARNWAAGETLASIKAKIESSGLPKQMESIPFFGPRISQAVRDFDPDTFPSQSNWSNWIFEGTAWGRILLSWVGAGLFCAAALAGLLKHGEKALERGQRFFLDIFGEAFVSHLQHQAALTRSIFNSIVLLGLTEAGMFWGAYTLVGLRQAALLALMTGAASIVPFVASVLTASACIYLAMTGNLTEALALGTFSVVVLMVLDPVIRPLLAGKNTEMPYWLSTIAMIAGVQSLGLIGLFIGPQLSLLLLHLFEVNSKRPNQGLGSPPNQ